MLSKKKKMIGVAVAVIVCLSVVGVWKITEPKEGNYPHFYTVDWTIDNTTDAWIINITNVTLHGKYDPEFNLSGKHVRCDVEPLNLSGPYDRVFLQDINGVSSSYGVTWNDNDNDNILSVGDNITINKAGGPDGKFEAGELFILFYFQEATGIVRVILP